MIIVSHPVKDNTALHAFTSGENKSVLPDLTSLLLFGHQALLLPEHCVSSQREGKQLLWGKHSLEITPDQFSRYHWEMHAAYSWLRRDFVPCAPAEAEVNCSEEICSLFSILYTLSPDITVLDVDW